MGPPVVPQSPWQTPKYTGEPWWTKDTVAVVTGSNRGIGYDTLREFAKVGLTTVLCDKDDCQASVSALKAEGFDSVFYHPLDVRSSESVATFATWLKEKFGGIDILVNNAGVWPRGGTYEDAKLTLAVNFFGVKRVTDGLLHLMRPSAAGARIVNVTSRLGMYQRLRSEKLKDKLRNTEHLSVEILEDLASKYLEAVKSGRLEEEGWLTNAALVSQYSVSKMLLSAYSMVLARNLQTNNPADQKTFAASFCPGLTLTDMTRGVDVIPGIEPHRVEVGTDTGVWLALLRKEDFAKLHGKFAAARGEYPYTWVPWIDPFSPPADDHSTP